jgi:quinolinate synthase
VRTFILEESDPSLRIEHFRPGIFGVDDGLVAADIERFAPVLRQHGVGNFPIVCAGRDLRSTAIEIRWEPEVLDGGRQMELGLIVQTDPVVGTNLASKRHRPDVPCTEGTPDSTIQTDDEVRHAGADYRPEDGRQGPRTPIASSRADSDPMPGGRRRLCEPHAAPPPTPASPESHPMLWQPPLPESHLRLEASEIARRIESRRSELGSDLLILGHHYQQDDVVRHADLTGDSLKLSRLAADEAVARAARHLVFCGVHFMAETADLLTPDEVEVILPDLSAGCSMADMAQWDDVVEAWESIEAVHRSASPSGVPLTRVVPITYVNSTAAIKAFVGARGGACCTSSNAEQVFAWALAGGAEPLLPGQRVQVLFLPDQHLGRNTAKRAGFLTEVDAARQGGRAETAVWNPRKELGGLDESTVRDASVLLWAGHCSVHKLFRPEHVEEIRAANDGTQVIVHPECCQEVVDLADRAGSTEFIVKEIEQAEAGTRWAVGTEIHLVSRLAKAAAARGVEVRILSDCQCLCTTMYRIDPPHLLWTLDQLADRRVVNRIVVHRDARADAIKALDRMLDLVERPMSAVAVD